MKNRAILSCWLLLGVACGSASGGGSPSMGAGGNPSGGTAGTSASGAGGSAVVTNGGGGGSAGTGTTSGGAGLGGSAGSAHGGGSGIGGGSAGTGGAGHGGSGTGGGSAGTGGSGGVKGVPGVPSGPVVLCFGNGCPLGTCDHHMILSQAACTSVYTSDVGPSSMFCNAGETGTYCLQVTDDFGDRFQITCVNGAATILRCNTGCGFGGNDPAMCE